MFWWSVFSFDGINNAAQTPQCLETSCTLKHTSFFNAFYCYFYIFNRWFTVLAVWWWCGVFQRVSAENMGPMQQAEISRAKTNTSHKQVSRNVQNLLEYNFPIRREIFSNCVTDGAVLTIVTMQSAFEPQARNTSFSNSSFWKTNEITVLVVYITTVCAKRIIDTIKVVK